MPGVHDAQAEGARPPVTTLVHTTTANIVSKLRSALASAFATPAYALA
jgi:hypothetical protein